MWVFVFNLMKTKFRYYLERAVFLVEAVRKKRNLVQKLEEASVCRRGWREVSAHAFETPTTYAAVPTSKGSVPSSKENQQTSSPTSSVLYI